MSRIVPDWIDGYMFYVDNSEPPESFHRWCAISVIAACLQRKCVVKWGTLKFYPNFYIVLVAPSGEARKGTAMGFAKDLLVDVGVRMTSESVTRAALVKELKDSVEKIGEDMTSPRFHSSITIFSPELAVFLGQNDSQFISDITDWYDCGHGPKGTWTYRTIGRGDEKISGGR